MRGGKFTFFAYLQAELVKIACLTHRAYWGGLPPTPGSALATMAKELRPLQCLKVSGERGKASKE